MKTILKIIGIFFALILLLAIVLPFIFKGKLTELAKTEINKNLNAKVDFNTISLSLFRSFPNFTLGIKGLTIVGSDPFQGDTLAAIPSLGITVDLMSVIRGSTYEIKKISLDSPSLLLKVLEDGTANYDIALETEETPESTPADDSEAFTLNLQKVQILDARIVYLDRMSGIESQIQGMDFVFSGDLGAEETTLRTSIDIEDLDLIYGGISYFSGVRVAYKADIHADLKNEIYTLQENSLSLNALLLEFDGSVSMVNEDFNIVMAFNTPKTDFKTILSLIPALYKRDYEDIEATGKLEMGGSVKGLYSETTLPSFDILIGIENGQFKYPELPQSVSNIDLDVRITNTGGDADNTVIDLSKFHMQMGTNPVDMRFLVKTPVSDPEIDGHINAKIDLESVQYFYPLEEGEELRGNIVADITLKGRLSAIENEEFESFTAIGSLLMQNFEYTNPYTGKPVKVSIAQLNFSPRYLDLVSFDCTIGESDIRASGKISNYIPYAFRDGVLSGSLTTQSKYVNLNTLMTEEEPVEATPADSSVAYVIEVPGNIDFKLQSSFDNLIYDTYEMELVNGNLEIKDKRLILHTLSMNLLDGEMVISGEYNTIDPEQPEFDFDMDIRNMEIQKAYHTFGVMSQFAPIANKTKGQFSSHLTMSSLLDQAMMPVYETMTGSGTLETTPLTIENINTLDKIAEALKYEPLKKLSIDKILLEFKFLEGKIFIEPFDIKQSDFTGTMTGWTGMDQTISYVMNLSIPMENFGQEANNVLNNLVEQANSKGAGISLGKTVSMDVLIGGTLTNPEVKTSLKEAGKNLVEDVKKQVEEEIQKQKEELTKEAREEVQKILDEAEKQAALLIAEAEKQAHNLRNSAADGARKVREEGEKQAKNIEDEGKKKGFLAEAAANETAKNLRKEVDNQAKNIEDEADRQAKAIIDKANQEAAQIKQNAQKEADKFLEIN